MNKLELFKKMMSKAKANGYKGDDYRSNMGYILDGTNFYSVIFREDFAKAVWGEVDGHYSGTELIHPKWKTELRNLASSDDRWKYLEENINFND